MQSDEDAKRILTLGAPKEKVFVSGNLKFDLSLLGFTSKRREVRDELGLKEDDVLFVAGSTHRGEDEEIIDCFSKLKKDYNKIRLLIAPRHIERAQEIEGLLARKGFEAIRYSQLAGGSLTTLGTGKDIFILDTIGNLKTIYSASDIVFVGGSLVKKGGQNPIEPGSLSKPIIFGQFTFNFQDVVKSFLENKAAIQVENKDELYSVIRKLLDNPHERKRLGINAKETVDKNSGSSQRTIDLILSHLKP